MALRLKKAGFEHVSALKGGFEGWSSAGHPVEPAFAITLSDSPEL
jgi:rhodanese-related sulfurtransferase